MLYHLNDKENVTSINLKFEKINLREITNFCKEICETLIIGKGKENSVIINDYDEDIENYKILSDEFRLKQIILNFLSNSVKFTKSGFIKIKS